MKDFVKSYLFGGGDGAIFPNKTEQKALVQFQNSSGVGSRRVNNTHDMRWWRKTRTQCEGAANMTCGLWISGYDMVPEFL